MTQSSNQDPDADELRLRAEQQLAAKSETIPDIPIDQRHLLHELQIHQIELEMQNEALQNARRAAESELKGYADLFDFAPFAYFALDRDGIIVKTNLCGEKLLAIARSQIAGQRFASYVVGEYRPGFSRFLEKVFESGNAQRCELTLRIGGAPLWVMIEAAADKTRQTCLAALLDITEKKRAEETISKQANIDPLTELPNRRLFLDRLQRAIKKSQRANRSLALLFLDLDHFKDINDTLGHDIGDDLLIQTAQRLKSCIRETDTLARPGGDEFTLIMDELDELGSIDRVALCILQCMTIPFQLKNERCYVSVSIGIALYPNDAATPDDLLKKADQALYAAKRQGRSRYFYFTPAMQSAAENRLRLANDLREALSSHQFWLAYQPIVELATDIIQKAEALIRWQHPARGLVSPIEFIPIAEDTGFIIELSEWIFQQAANQVAVWRKDHCAHFQISINKSSAQFYSNRGHASWIQHLHRLQLPGCSTAVEITEGLLLEDTSNLSEKLLTLKNAGIQVWLDDFGAGYSSLSYLNKFHIDNLKISQDIICNLTANSTNMALCEAIILMAHKLGMKVIAEGIETQEQRALLQQAGCDYGQGYLFSRALPAVEFEKFFIAGHRYP